MKVYARLDSLYTPIPRDRSGSRSIQNCTGYSVPFTRERTGSIRFLDRSGAKYEVDRIDEKPGTLTDRSTVVPIRFVHFSFFSRGNPVSIQSETDPVARTLKHMKYS